MKISNTAPLWRNLMFAAFITLAVQCSKDDHDHPEEIHEGEEINRVTLTITDSSNNAVPVTWNEGATVPTITLNANATYNVSIQFFDASDASDVEDITEEVVEEADEHQVFYAVAGANVTIASADNDTSDSNGNSLLLKTVWTTAAAGSGTIRAYLIHEPTTKTATTRDGFGGETDVEVDFPVVIQ